MTFKSERPGFHRKWRAAIICAFNSDVIVKQAEQTRVRHFWSGDVTFWEQNNRLCDSNIMKVQWEAGTDARSVPQSLQRRLKCWSKLGFQCLKRRVQMRLTLKSYWRNVSIFHPSFRRMLCERNVSSPSGYKQELFRWLSYMQERLKRRRFLFFFLFSISDFGFMVLSTLNKTPKNSVCLQSVQIQLIWT